MEKPLVDFIQKVFIDESAATSELANRAYDFFPADRIQITSGHPYPKHRGQLGPSQYNKSKRELYITDFQGQFFKRCPGAKPGLACCNYFVLNLGAQCNMNCSYCYLQSYINSPTLTVYTGIERALTELKEIAVQFPDRHYRVGTGETTDSLSLDDFTLYSRRLISFFADLPQWKLELKSKSAKVDQFLDLPHAGNVIVSWSINPEYIVQREEHDTASLSDRLRAARKCRERGYPLTFHIDPMIWHPEWKENYAELVDQIARDFSPDEVLYITVGALRYAPEQKHLMRDRFGMESLCVQAETFLGESGKMRYDSRLRSEMFRFLMDRFKGHSPNWKISLCMETPENWATTMASTPTKVPEIRELFMPPQRKLDSTHRQTNP